MCVGCSVGRSFVDPKREPFLFTPVRSTYLSIGIPPQTPLSPSGSPRRTERVREMERVSHSHSLLLPLVRWVGWFSGGGEGRERGEERWFLSRSQSWMILLRTGNPPTTTPYDSSTIPPFFFCESHRWTSFVRKGGVDLSLPFGGDREKGEEKKGSVFFTDPNGQSILFPSLSSFPQPKKTNP